MKTKQNKKTSHLIALVRMAEEELGFDPTLKKKKKKKKPLAELDDGLESAAAEPVAAAVEADEGEVDFSTLKKKKKKKKKFDLEGEDEANGGAAAAAAAAAAAPGSEATAAAAAGGDEAAAAAGGGDGVAGVKDALDDLSLNFDAEFSLPAKKKKKKKKKVVEEAAGDIAEAAIAAEADASGGAGAGGVGAAAESGRDYTYKELLERVYSIIYVDNPKNAAGEKRRIVMKPPQVTRVGTRKSAFVNFTDICKMLHRQPDHLLQFLFAELGTSGSVDQSNALVIRGRYQQKQIESILRRYIREYVTCRNCKSPDTILVKENRLHFMQCMVCRSKCSVASIKTGFQAVTGKRRVLRQKAAA